MKTNIKLALVSALTLMIATQPAHGMHNVKDQLFKTNRLATYASIVTFVGLITGNKKLALAGACVLPLGLMKAEHYKHLLEKAVKNWELITCAAMLAGTGYQIWNYYTALQQSQKRIENARKSYPRNKSPKQLKTDCVLEDTFLNEIFDEESKQEAKPVLIIPVYSDESEETESQETSPRVGRVPTTPTESCFIIPRTNVVLTHPKELSREDLIQKTAKEIREIILRNDFGAPIDLTIKCDDILKQDETLLKDVLKYENKMLAHAAKSNAITKTTMQAVYQQRKISF